MHKEKKEKDYKRMFQFGVILVGTGVALSVSTGPVGVAMIGLGALMMLEGGRHRDEWKDEGGKKGK